VFLQPSAASSAAHADPLKATVIHWWTSGGESAAIKQFADAYNKAGGLWVGQRVAGAAQARSTALNRIMGGDPPTAAQFNTSKQFHDIIDQGLLNNVDDVAAKENWTRPSAVDHRQHQVQRALLRCARGIHMPAWFLLFEAGFPEGGHCERAGQLRRVHRGPRQAESGGCDSAPRSVVRRGRRRSPSMRCSPMSVARTCT